jgi:hypothetical protein
MIDLDTIGEDLFSKIRGRFPDVTIGDGDGTITNEPTKARFFDFDYKAGERNVGKISVSISEDDGLSVIFSKDFMSNEDDLTQKEWYEFLKELRQFARKRLLNFDVRDVNKSNLSKRDYKFLATNRSGDDTMNESKLYGTARVSYQKVGEARIMIKHTENINQESATGRTQKIGKIYIESPEGERFKYPYKHLTGARAMARHVAEGGNAYDDFGKHIVGLSEEMAKLRKFKNYMSRSAVMAESLAGYTDIVKERIATVKKEIASLQKPAYYKEAFESFNPPVLEDVPSDVAENWIDELTIRQFNEELQDIFPYIYNLVKEGTKAVELGPDDLDESGLQYYTGVKKHGKEYMKKAAQAGREGASQEELGRLKDKYSKAEKNKKTKEEFELEQAFEDTMGQFADSVCEDCGNPSWRTLDEEKQKGVDGKVCWKGYRRMGTKMKGGKRVDNCVKVKEGESEFDGHDIMSEDPPNGIDFDYANLSKVNWAQYSEEDIKTFYSIVDNLSFESGYYNDGEFDVSHAKALQWLEKNVMNKAKGKKIESEQDIEEAYIKTRKDAVEALARLRGIGKKIETGRDTYEGNLANEYVSDVYDVYNWMDARLGISGMNDPKLKAVLDPVMELRGYAKTLETKPGSGENARFGNQIVSVLYPLLVYIRDHMELPKDEGNAYAHAVRKAKMDGKKKGDKVQGPDGDEITLEKDDKTPLGEFILSYYDRETGKFPKGETAVLTMVEKDYGEQFIEPAKAFIESVHQTFEAFQMAKPSIEDSDEYNRMRELAGLR